VSIPTPFKLLLSLMTLLNNLKVEVAVNVSNNVVLSWIGQTV
jgi:hypothetical protein